jgi:adenylate kinase family enzyme
MRRVSVVGNSGAGKTHLARRIADVLGVQHVREVLWNGNDQQISVPSGR